MTAYNTTMEELQELHKKMIEVCNRVATDKLVFKVHDREDLYHIEALLNQFIKLERIIK